ncbi:sugar ABC transporter ATP-binding protein [Saccharomonospora saliphila]|uniref:sugar ABC transporter ATP-binding protein n=1 Tax=Saccharomonospora saliphila TaxID=369829 RepID=UPI00037B65F1|nr:sugar ABC transporter ATP-binding protein [Saccharomonospora saliphila]
MPLDEALLKVRGIAKSYGTVVALRSADLTVRPGESHALLGANGAGKSTLVKIITGVLHRDAGSITMAGEPVELRSPADGYAKGIATVFQDPAMVPDLTIEQNLKLTGTDTAAVTRRLVEFGIGELSLAERTRDVPLPFLRMLDLARALTHRPRLLVLDEITAALPADLATTVFDVMARHISGGGSVLFISHRLEEVVRHCSMCTVFRDGGDVASFPPRAGGEQRIVQSMLGETVGQMAEETVGARRGPVERTDRPPRLVVENLRAGPLRDVSFSVRPGEVLGVTGLEGQGQDMLFEVLAGAQRAREGRVVVDGEEISPRHPATAIRHGLALVPSDRSVALLPQRSIRENIALSSRARPSRWGPISMKKENRAVSHAVERLSIDTRAASQARRLSGGNQQKLTIGRWLAEGFTTLLLFDPTRGIDIGTKRQIYTLVRELADNGAAVVLYTSELREIELVCDRAVVLYHGEIVAELPADAGEEAILSAAHGFVGEPEEAR